MSNFIKNSEDQKVEYLASLMSNLSEEKYSAGWIVGLEYSLWNAIKDADSKENETWDLSQRKINELNALSEEISGWVMWKDSANGLDDNRELWRRYFVPMSEWLKIFESKGLPKNV